MRIFVIASHGKLAEGALDSARMIMGSASEVIAYSLQPGESACDFAEELSQRVANEPHNEFIIAADLYGASVCTALYPLTLHPNVRLFSGFNLCMLLEMLGSVGDTVMGEDEIEELLSRARSGIRYITYKAVKPQANEDF